jgi:HK97 family phage major capsid protein
VSAKLDALNKEINDIADRLTILVGSESRSEQDVSEMNTLSARSETVRNEIEREETMQKKLAELRAVADRATPAAPKAEAKKAEIRGLPYSFRPLTAFTGPNAEERAYRAGHWYLANLFGSESSKRFCRENGIEARAQSEGDNSLGGNLVVPEVLAQILTLVNTYGQYPSAVRNQVMQSEVLSVPRRVGGLTAYWVDEATEPTQSDANWDRVTLTARKIAVQNRQSTELMQDSIVDIANVLTEEFARAFAYKIDHDGFLGDSSGNDGGVTGLVTALSSSHAASLVTAPAGETGFDTLSLDTAIQVVARIQPYARAGAKWYISPAGYAEFMQRIMMHAGGIRPDDLAGATQVSFLGFPVVLCNVLDSTLGVDGNKIKVLFGNLQQSSMLGTRRSMTMRVSDQRLVELDQVLMIANTRIAISNHSLGTNSVAGPVIALKTHAAS